jgi:hypothetical protein
MASNSRTPGGTQVDVMVGGAGDVAIALPDASP